MKNNKREVLNEAKKPISVPTIEPTSLPPPEPISEEFEKGNKKLFLLGIIFLIFIVLTTAGILILTSTTLPKGNTIKTLELDVKTPAVQETKQPTLNRSEWTLEVLNGSGVAGSALSAARKLEGLGYTVITIDNADKQTYTLTEVSVAKEKFDQSDLLLEDLKTEFPSATLSGELTINSTASARIIIGNE